MQSLCLSAAFILHSRYCIWRTLFCIRRTCTTAPLCYLECTRSSSSCVTETYIHKIMYTGSGPELKNHPRSVQSVSIRSPPLSSRLAWSCNARKKGSIPVPASSGRPNVRTRSPSSPVRSAMSRFRTAARNWGDCTMRSRVSTLGGLGRSGGRCGKSDCTSSGRDAKSGRRFAGVRTSVSEISGSGSAAGAPLRPPRVETIWRMRASSSGVAWYPPDEGCELRQVSWVGWMWAECNGKLTS